MTLWGKTGPDRLSGLVLAVLVTVTVQGFTRGTATAATFSNPAPIIIPEGAVTHGPAAPYPSSIIVSGLTGTVSKVTVRLNRVSHNFPADIDLLLVGPGGQAVVLMSDAGLNFPINDVTLTFNDLAPEPPPCLGQITSDTFKPSNCFGAPEPDIWPSHAPPGPYGTALSAFDGTNPNGTWSLFVFDDELADIGSIAGGWSLTISTCCGDGGGGGGGPTHIGSLVTGAGSGGGPHVRVFDGVTGSQLPGLIGSFFAYDPAFTGGVFVACGDVNGDGVDDVVTGAGSGGGPHVRMFDGVTGSQLPGPIGSFFAYNPAFTGGVRVAICDVNGDGQADIVTGAGAGGGPHVRVFDGATGGQLAGPVGSFFAYDPAFTGGVFVACGEVNGDGFADLITGAGAGGGPHVRVFSGVNGNELLGFFAYDPAFTGGARVASCDVNGNDQADVVTGAGPGGGPHVRVFDGVTGSQLPGLIGSFFAYDPAFTGGVFVGCR